MSAFERSALRYLEWHWKAAEACARQRYAPTAYGTVDLHNPWTHVHPHAAVAIEAAEAAGIWPEDVPLCPRPAENSGAADG